MCVTSFLAVYRSKREIIHFCLTDAGVSYLLRLNRSHDFANTIVHESGLGLAAALGCSNVHTTVNGT